MNRKIERISPFLDTHPVSGFLNEPKRGRLASRSVKYYLLIATINSVKVYDSIFA